MALVNGFRAAAFSVDGARHPASLLRLLAYGAMGAAEGVITPGDLKVRALTTPGSQVRIDVGAASVLNRSPNVKNQMYMVEAPIESRVDVVATGGSSRTDMVLVRVEDPEFPTGGFAGPPDATAALTWQYVKPFVLQNVPAGATTAAELNLGYPALELARIAIPANTATITDQMITDLRKVARPREKRIVQLLAPPAEDALTQIDWRSWPNWTPTILVPTWASRAMVLGQLYSVGHRLGTTAGALATQLGTLQSPEVPYDLTSVGGDGERLTLAAMGDFAVPTNMRGTNQILKIAGRRDTGEAGHLVTVAGTQLIFDVTFYEATS